MFLARNALSTRKKSAGSKLNDYFLWSGPLHDYFLRSVMFKIHYKHTTINGPLYAQFAEFSKST